MLINRGITDIDHFGNPWFKGTFIKKRNTSNDTNVSGEILGIETLIT